MKTKLLFILLLLSQFSFSQDLSVGYIANDLQQHPMQALNPAYLASVTDPSFTSTQYDVFLKQLQKILLYQCKVQFSLGMQMKV